MMDCICNSCINLKSIINETGDASNNITETCGYGFPSEDCAACVLEGCHLTCEHYEAAENDVHYVLKECALCHKSLQVAAGKAEDGEHFCVSCYLSKK